MTKEECLNIILRDLNSISTEGKNEKLLEFFSKDGSSIFSRGLYNIYQGKEFDLECYPHGSYLKDPRNENPNLIIIDIILEVPASNNYDQTMISGKKNNVYWNIMQIYTPGKVRQIYTFNI